MWSFGALMAALVFETEPFFRGIDNFDQLIKTVAVLGTTDL
jgi:casein kinase II subunit alpha